MTAAPRPARAAPLRIAVLALVLGAAWLASLLPATPARASGSKAIWGPVYVNGASEFPVYHDLGVGIYEMTLSWADVAPTRPADPRNPSDAAYVWPVLVDDAIQEASRYGMRVMLQLIHTPSWANGGRAFNWAPSRPADLADFATAAARRYPTVHLWMIWGEPNRTANLVPLDTANPDAPGLTRHQAQAPHRYARMLDASYGALKAVSPRNLVIGGNTFTTGDIYTPQWIENLRLPDGRPPRMDLYGHNPFCVRAPDLANPPSPHHAVDFSDLARLSRLVNRNLAPPGHHLRLFLSEWTIPTSAQDREFDFSVTPEVQAQWIADAWRIVRSNSFIYALGWINLMDDPPGQGTTGGLLDDQGNPKPSYAAFKNG